MPRFASGSTVGPYTILDGLATGGMAEVYLALNAGPSGFARVLALKVILPHLASDSSFLRMFEDEARIAGLLNHPGVVQVFDFGVDRGVQYMAMEYVDGPNLGRTLAQLGSQQLIPIPLTLRIMADACAALHYAHTLHQGGEPLRFVHRDVSLENILVSYAGQTKISDFGIAKARNAVNVTVHGALKGKHGYIAPEALEGRRIDHRVDIFAVGVTLYSLLTGLSPFRGDSLARPRPVAPRELNPAIPAELDRLVLRAMENDPDRRFQSAAELRDELEELMRVTGVGLPRELAAFLAQAFPAGTDPLHDRYRAAVDRCMHGALVTLQSPVPTAEVELETVRRIPAQGSESAAAAVSTTADTLAAHSQRGPALPATTDTISRAIQTSDRLAAASTREAPRLRKRLIVAMRRRPGLWFGLVLAALAAPVVVVVSTWPLPNPPALGSAGASTSPLAEPPRVALATTSTAHRITISVRAVPANAVVVFGGERMPNPFRLGRTSSERYADLVISAPGYGTLHMPVHLARSGNYDFELVLDSPPPKPEAKANPERLPPKRAVRRKPAHKKATAPKPPAEKEGEMLSDKEVLSNPYP